MQVKVSHIFVAIPENADAAKVLERERYAKKILARAQAGEEFAALAKELSEDGATRAEGGDSVTSARRWACPSRWRSWCSP